MLDELRRVGVSERTVQLERDGWILVAALSPEVIPEWVGVKPAALDDPESPLHLPPERPGSGLGSGRLPDPGAG